MSLSNGNTVPTTFVSLNSKIGKLVTRSADGSKSEFTQTTDVKLTKIIMENDEYEGSPIRKVRLFLSAKEGREIVDSNITTYATALMLAALNKVDLSQAFGIKVTQDKAGSTFEQKDGTQSQPLGADLTKVSIWQGSAYIKLVESEKPPKSEKVMVGKKEVTDSSKREDFSEALVAQIAAKLAKSGTTDDYVPPAGSAPSAEDLQDGNIPF